MQPSLQMLGGGFDLASRNARHNSPASMTRSARISKRTKGTEFRHSDEGRMRANGGDGRRVQDDSLKKKGGGGGVGRKDRGSQASLSRRAKVI
jgi:hypothetical protein